MTEFLLDQDVYEKTRRCLVEAGYQCVTVREIGMDRATDKEILAEAGRRSCLLITRDKGYGALVFTSRTVRSGVVLLRMVPGGIDSVHAQLLRAIGEQGFDRLRASFMTVEENKYRLRHVSRPYDGPKSQ